MRMEWNDGALAVMLLLFLIPTVIVYFILKWIITVFPSISLFIVEAKKSRLILYVIIHIGLVVLSVALTVGLLSALAFIKGDGLLGY